MQIFGSKQYRDYTGGGIMLLLGIASAIQGSTYPMGTLNRMGPGMFPTALGVILAFLGMVLLVTAKLSEPVVDRHPRSPEWRGWFCIVLSIASFVVLGTYGGLLPATFAIVFISALGDRQNTIVSALILSLAIVAVCVVVFWWALQLQFPLLNWG